MFSKLLTWSLGRLDWIYQPVVLLGTPVMMLRSWLGQEVELQNVLPLMITLVSLCSTVLLTDLYYLAKTVKTGFLNLLKIHTIKDVLMTCRQSFSFKNQGHRRTEWRRVYAACQLSQNSMAPSGTLCRECAACMHDQQRDCQRPCILLVWYLPKLGLTLKAMYAKAVSARWRMFRTNYEIVCPIR